jgi:hypothetical protein
MKSAAMIAPGSAGFAVTRGFGPAKNATAITSASSKAGFVPSSLPTQFGKSESLIASKAIKIGSNNSYKHADFSV